MKTSEIREKFIKFFVQRGHNEIEPAPLVLENDFSTLFVSAGMQPLVPYLKGKRHPGGARLVNSQPCLRMEDIDEIGDNRHITYFEMLGNWSLGDPASPDGVGQGGYWKKEQLNFFWELLIYELGLSKDKLYVTVFEGDKNVSKDEESYRAWRKIGVSRNHIFYYGADKNWWSRSGAPDKMIVGDIGGPDSEVFYDFGKDLGLHEKSEFKGRKCHPNCGCGRFLEIGNSVFIQYVKKDGGDLGELPQTSVDFGAGLERVAAAVLRQPDIFKLDVFEPVIALLERESGKIYGASLHTDEIFRVIADHSRAIVTLIANGVRPSNKLHGYVLRRLTRRAFVRLRKLSLKKPAAEVMKEACGVMGGGVEVRTVVGEEIESFERVLDKGVLEVLRNDKMKPFDLFQSWGVPWEVAREIFSSAGRVLSEIDRKEFEEEYERHREISRLSSNILR